jgi:hypothetical protein
METLKICWISAGVSSFISGYLEKDTIDKFIYIDVEDQHPDSLRFIADCEAKLGKQIEVLRSAEYRRVGDVCRAFRFAKSPRGAKCTEVLKKRVRKKWEYEHQGLNITYVWGMDVNECGRAERLIEGMPQVSHEFPLIERQLSKADAHGICKEIKIARPIMYDMGYSNNNCIGCVKGGCGYWNKIRRDFPAVFADRAKMEREMGHSILYNANGMLFLDELDPNAGRMNEEVMEDCSIFCQLAIQ